MSKRQLSTPAFGQADLSNCEREQIHLAGSIQPHGALLVVREPDYEIVQSSTNAADFIGTSDTLLGRSLDALEGDLFERITPHLADPLHAMPVAVRCHLGRPLREFDCLLHRSPDGGLIVELERASAPINFSHAVDDAMQKVIAASSLRSLCDESARIFRDLTGYDRVMVYRFDEKGHGEVFSEERKAELEAYLGNWYPASDIPQIARRLYERNRVRVLVDVGYEPVPVIPRRSPITGTDLDMSLCFLRSMSPIHIQYLKNMGVRATLVVSLLVGGRLWGLIACHHYSPRFVPCELRNVCELLAEAIGTRIAALESFLQAQSDLFVRRLEQRMVETISREGDWRQALFDRSQSMLQPLGATGGALLFEGQVLTVGDVPGTQDIKNLGTWLDGRRDDESTVFATASLGSDEPKFAALASVASGFVAVSISNMPSEYLIWFRPERVRTVTWGGNPLKPVLIGNDPSQLSPRLSFAQWHQQVEGTCEPWAASDLAAARMIGEIVADVVMQFRSVRMLIAQDQLEQVSRHVRGAAQPVIITDTQGRILLINDAFEGLLRAGYPHLQRIDDLSQFFVDPMVMRRNFRDILQRKRSWRGEVQMKAEAGAPKSLMLRVDPVFSAPDRMLGFVLLFVDLTERKAVDAARRRFQEDLIERHQITTVRLDTETDLVYQDLLSRVVENAQLAALEITYGVDTGKMPEMLEAVRSSATRTAELLAHLVWHASRASKDGK